MTTNGNGGFTTIAEAATVRPSKKDKKAQESQQPVDLTATTVELAALLITLTASQAYTEETVTVIINAMGAIEAKEQERTSLADAGDPMMIGMFDEFDAPAIKAAKEKVHRVLSQNSGLRLEVARRRKRAADAVALIAKVSDIEEIDDPSKQRQKLRVCVGDAKKADLIKENDTATEDVWGERPLRFDHTIYVLAYGEEKPRELFRAITTAAKALEVSQGEQNEDDSARLEERNMLFPRGTFHRMRRQGTVGDLHALVKGTVNQAIVMVAPARRGLPWSAILVDKTAVIAADSLQTARYIFRHRRGDITVFDPMPFTIVHHGHNVEFACRHRGVQDMLVQQWKEEEKEAAERAERSQVLTLQEGETVITGEQLMKGDAGGACPVHVTGWRSGDRECELALTFLSNGDGTFKVVRMTSETRAATPRDKGKGSWLEEYEQEWVSVAAFGRDSRLMTLLISNRIPVDQAITEAAAAVGAKDLDDFQAAEAFGAGADGTYLLDLERYQTTRQRWTRTSALITIADGAITAVTPLGFSAKRDNPYTQFPIQLAELGGWLRWALGNKIREVTGIDLLSGEQAGISTGDAGSGGDDEQIFAAAMKDEGVEPISPA